MKLLASIAVLLVLQLLQSVSALYHRKNVADLTQEDISDIQAKLRTFKSNSADGFNKLASFHGEPKQCGKYVCCFHGMASFLPWHRLYTAQFEQLLGYSVPYWDWTSEISDLPELVRESVYYDVKDHGYHANSWYDSELPDGHGRTSRAVDDRLYERLQTGQFSELLERTFDAMEETDYCQFATAMEVAHNAVHFLVGGKKKYSMAILDWTSYDPIFFLHHSNVDRLFVIWQKLQVARGIPLTRDSLTCALNEFDTPLEPFKRATNTVQVTKQHSRPRDTLDTLDLEYTYDDADLTLGGMNIQELNIFLENRRKADRVFANFRLEGLAESVDVQVSVCKDDRNDRTVDDCEKAGYIFLLGGQNEMPWAFNYAYKYDVTKTVKRMGLDIEDAYYVKAETFAQDGRELVAGDSFYDPKVNHQPPVGFADAPPTSVSDNNLVVRKDVDRLTEEEIFNLREALRLFREDDSVAGYDAMAEYHGVPSKCPHPDATLRYACCAHGMPTFPMWHRLYMVQAEDGLTARGFDGLPYWDWSVDAGLPSLVTEETYIDPNTKIVYPNPFNHGHISENGGFIDTERGGSSVDINVLREEMLLAFEQDDFCDFEVQMEITHNKVHAWIGGDKTYSLSSLHYTAYDPVFYLHHSNVDRVWAIWQSLQIRRGKPYKAHCAASYTQEAQKPFAFDNQYNTNERTRQHSIPSEANIYSYQAEFGYTFDSLDFAGMNLDQLESAIRAHQIQDRVFVGVILEGIKDSGKVDINVKYVNDQGNQEVKVGDIFILGGPQEMYYRFDRLYKYDITEKLKELNLDHTSQFSVSLTTRNLSGNIVDVALYKPTILFEGKSVQGGPTGQKGVVRKSVDTLTPDQLASIRSALAELEDDLSPSGFTQMGFFHGYPNWCGDAVKEACCHHGMPTFPHWHRLLTKQFEVGLQKYNWDGGVPYWDWTRRQSSYPALVADENDAEGNPNPWYNFVIKDGGDHPTTRSDGAQLFQSVAFGEYSLVAEQMMLAMEQTDFCKFEIQFEIAHNLIHALVGTTNEYSMSSLKYTAFDPLFYLHHSNVDRLWAVWQALQKYRGKAYNTANCAVNEMRMSLKPFSLGPEVNPYDITRQNSVSLDLFDYGSLDYSYDNLEFNGLTISQLAKETERRHSRDRVFAGFLLRGFKKTCDVKFYIQTDGGTKTEAGRFYVLGDAAEMPWDYTELYKYEITEALKGLGLGIDDHFDITYSIYNLDGTLDTASTNNKVYGTPTVIVERASGTYSDDEFTELITSASQVRKEVSQLTPGEIASLRDAFNNINSDGNYSKIATAHGYPGLCNNLGCCVHGMATFPHWHRLYLVDVETSLLQHGSAVALPYWDWTSPSPGNELPSLLGEARYYNTRTQTFDDNPFFRGTVTDKKGVAIAKTDRDISDRLFDWNYFNEGILYAFEQTDYCDFEIQLEIIHNAVHSWMGGTARYSMSSLDYTAFDAAFFLHHANVDRLWAIWQELQRFRKLSYRNDCAKNLMSKTLYPFGFDGHGNQLTHDHSTASEAWDYQNTFYYTYGDLLYHGMGIPELESTLKERQSRDRLFAGFLLHNISTSADVHIYVCVQYQGREENCDQEVGEFAVLGGLYEMPFYFDRLYKVDITKGVKQLGLSLDGSEFRLRVVIKDKNGAILPSDSIPSPTLLLEPGIDDHTHQGTGDTLAVRKDVDSLTPQETADLYRAMYAIEQDHSANGFGSIAAFHAIPPLCPYPTAADPWACCTHGMATFLNWHRLYVVQMEDALHTHGAPEGLPYWDWTKPMTALPEFVTAENWHDPGTDQDIPNPFNHAEITDGVTTERDLDARLFETPSDDHSTWLYDNVMLALENEDYCDFEIQLEVVHNAIHAWVGGSKIKSMAHLHYTSYDPLFYMHHSMVDKILAIWQELQVQRGLDATPNCALDLMSKPLMPFSFGSPYNVDPITTEWSKPEDTFDYKNHFRYEFDDLSLGGMNVPALNEYLLQRQDHKRTFVGFLLHGVGATGEASFKLCSDATNCVDGGTIYILGGEKEMPWRFDRLYKYEVTSIIEKLGWNDFFVTYEVKDPFNEGATFTGDKDPILAYSVFCEGPSETVASQSLSENRVRKNVKDLSESEKTSLRSALTDTKADGQFATLASFHGVPVKCDPYACCLHGMETFPHWHRLYTVAFENALRNHGSSAALPYWDWTEGMDSLPDFVTEDKYYPVWNSQELVNPFSYGQVDAEHRTSRDIQDILFRMGKGEEYSLLYEGVLFAFEQTDYCHFEIQFEIIHNAVHYLVGGHAEYSMASLDYTAYDPIFYLHHSNADRLWAIWQELQLYRGLPYQSAYCAINHMTDTMRPFNDEALNIDPVSRSHSVANQVWDYRDLGYTYDDLKFHGMSIAELEEEVHRRQLKPRVFADFQLAGFKKSADAQVSVCKGEVCEDAGFFYVLGSDTEMPWQYNYPYEYEITKALSNLGIEPEAVFDRSVQFEVKVEVRDVNGVLIENKIQPPTIAYKPAEGQDEDPRFQGLAGVGFRKNVYDLNVEEINNLRDAMRAVQGDTSNEGYDFIASFHGLPPMCDGLSCCLHGMPQFPHWHRLSVVQMEQALAAQGAQVGLPYWDWTSEFKTLPPFVTDQDNNPFYDTEIRFLGNGQRTTRSPDPQLFTDATQDEQNYFYRQMLFAFEQRSYCDFEVQFEMTHNLIHAMVGGSSEFGMSSLDYTAYDPLFYVAHSGVDRLFAIWQALQKFRDLPYNEARCSIQDMKKPIRPFSDDINPNKVTKSHSTAVDSFDYEALGYTYDSLKFNGMSIPDIEKAIYKEQEQDRIFAGFLLEGFEKSAVVSFEICRSSDDVCKDAGKFAILGSDLEMPWRYDRLFRYEVTDTMKDLQLQPDSAFYSKVHVNDIKGNDIEDHKVGNPEVDIIKGTADPTASPAARYRKADIMLRKDIQLLSFAESSGLKNALYQLKNLPPNDNHSFEYTAGFHGYPFMCPENGDDQYACCTHGMALFPHFHRLLAVQFEQGLKGRGSRIGIPYWDWTAPFQQLPSLLREAPFDKYHIVSANQDTVRTANLDIDSTLTQGYNRLYYLTLSALEEDNFCDFEVQYEMMHNELHILIGGTNDYSMSTLEYSAFDPSFMVHHASVDRIWIIWQQLQKLRGYSYRSASCIRDQHAGIQPFNYESVNPYPLTRKYSNAFDAESQSNFKFWYDNLDLNGRSVEETEEIIDDLRQKDRLFAGFVLFGFRESAIVTFYLHADGKDEVEAGHFDVLGGEKEMPWAYERAFKYDITEIAQQQGLKVTSDYHFRVVIKDYTGKELKTVGLPLPVVIERKPNTRYDIVVIEIGAAIAHPSKMVVKAGTHIEFHHLPAEESVAAVEGDAIVEVYSYTVWKLCLLPKFDYTPYEFDKEYVLGEGDHFFAAKNGCGDGDKIQITVTP